MNESEQEIREIMEAIAAAELIRGQAYDAQKSLDAIEAARRQLSMASDELRGQHTAIKDRITWLILELDQLKRNYLDRRDAK